MFLKTSFWRKQNFVYLYLVGLDVTYIDVSLLFSNFWMSTQNVSLWVPTMWGPSRCSRSVSLSVGAALCSWERIPWCERPSRTIWRLTPLWRSCCHTSKAMWALCSLVETLLRFVTCILDIIDFYRRQMQCCMEKDGGRDKLKLLKVPRCFYHCYKNS